MPFTSGTYALPAGNPVVTGTTISSTTTNTTNSDIATALSSCILKDGTQTVTANIPMASHKFTGLSAPTTVGDSLAYGSPINTTAITGITTPLSAAQGGTGFVDGTPMFRNRIINGAMVIDQRNAGASVTYTNTVGYGLDRFRNVAIGTSLGFSVVRSTTAPTGFTNSLLATVTTAKSPASTDQARINQTIEGYNVADLGWGTANAKTVTLSFWVQSSVTGTYFAALTNASSATRSYPAPYTINSANTWEQKTITVAGDTTGTWGTINGDGITVSFSLGCGTSFNASSANAWSTGEYYQTLSQTNLLATNGATFYITGVQLEKGSTATSFDYRPYGTELALCQRYYQTYSDRANTKGSYYTVNAGKVSGNLAPLMRASPTTTLTGTSYEYVGIGAVTGTNGAVSTTTTGYYFDATSLSGGIYAAQLMYLGTVSLSAEL